MWVKRTDNNGLINLSQVSMFQISSGSNGYTIQAVSGNSSFPVGGGYSSEAAAQAALDAFIVWDLDA